MKPAATRPRWLAVLACASLIAPLPLATGTQRAESERAPPTPAPYVLEVPAGFPYPVIPEDNPLTVEGVELGRFLFYDTALSADETKSCSSCHLPSQAFTDGRSVPIGVGEEPGIRNSQTLTNAAYNPTYGWANPLMRSIEKFTLNPLFGDHPVELGLAGRENEAIARLAASHAYQDMFAAAFPDDPDPISVGNIVMALSSFVRTMISGDSAYDRFVYNRDFDALSESAVRRLNLFLSERTECHHCHGGFNFNGSAVHAGSGMEETAFHNTGLYNLDGQGRYPNGSYGVFDITNNPRDMGRFRAPTLRNVAVTAPYFHDGSAQTLEEVIRFYEAGGRLIEDGPYAGDGRQNPLKSGFIAGFQLSDQERQDMINFLESLTDYTFLANPHLSNPFEEATE